MRSSLLLISLLSTWPTMVAQHQRATHPQDAAPARTAHDSVRFAFLLKMAGDRIGTDPDTAFILCWQAFALAPNTGHEGAMGEVEDWLGYLEEHRGNIQQALDHYSTSLAEAERLQDSAGLSTVLNNVAAIYKDQGRIDEALAAHERSLAIRRAKQDTVGIATSMNNMGLILYDQGILPEEMDHFAEALRSYEAAGNADGTATALHNIAGFYRDQGDLGEALNHFTRALNVQEKVADDHGIRGIP